MNRRERILDYLRRRKEGALAPDEEARLREELEQSARQAGPPSEQAEKRPRARGEKR